MALAAVLAARSLVFIAGAFISILVDNGRRGICSCHKLHVFHRSECVCSAARSSALAVLEPVDTVVAGPLTNSPCHLSDVLSHVVKVGAVTSCLHNFAVTLSHCHCVAHKLAITLLKVKFDMELKVSVDARRASR